jgi:S-adenosylmethionine:tRNA ribosyltransferase-isomerase
MTMLVADFDYELPEELIAQRPPEVRGKSRMLTLDRRTGVFADRTFAELPQLLAPGDVLVLNDSRVIPARLFATRAGLTTQRNSPAPSGHVEVLLTERLASPDGHNDWSALVRPAKKVQPGETLHVHAGHEPLLTATVLSAGEYGERTLRFDPVSDFYAALDAIGHLPLPPYIRRPKGEPNSAEDRERYQTVYSGERGSAAAPTAGLHFTPEILAELEARGVEIARITLHVGLGTFQPAARGALHDLRRDRRSAEPRPRRRPPHRRSRNNDDAHARARRARAGALRSDGDRSAFGQHEPLSFARPERQLRAGRRAADELPPAAVDAADAGFGVCGEGRCDGGVCARGGGEVSVFQLWRLHAASLRCI